jgi:hypothetical protein
MKNRFLLIALAVIVLGASTAAEHWPQWRGPLLNGISGEKNLPVRWSATENITWKLAVPERSGATPIVWGDHVFLNVGEGADLSLKLDACLELWVARGESGLAEGFEELGERAEALARALDDRQRLAQVRVRQAQGSWVIWLRPDGLATAIERSREAFDLAVPSDLRTRSYARFLAGAASLALGRLR